MNDDQNWHIDFEKKHGDSITCGGWVYFEDGAEMEASSYGVRRLPPSDDNERIAKLKRYYELKVEILSKQFRAKKAELEIASNSGHAEMSPSDVKFLEDLQQKVLKAQAVLEQLAQSEEMSIEAERMRVDTIADEIEKHKKELAKIRRTLEQERIKSLSERGHIADWNSLSRRAEELKKEINRLNRQWRQLDGNIRHVKIMDARRIACEKTGRKLDEITI